MYIHTYIYVCVYTYIHTCMFLLSGYVLTHMPVSILAKILRMLHTHTVSDVTHSSHTWALLLKNVRLTPFNSKNCQCICLI